MQVETESGIWLKADEKVMRLLMSVDRTGRRMQAAARTIVAAYKRVAQLRKRQNVQAAREHAAAERSVEQEFKRAWGPAIRVRSQKEYCKAGDSGAKRKASESRPSTKSQRSRRLRSYNAPLLDAKRRVALFLLMRYVGFKSRGWRNGISADHALYILREAALELVKSGGLETLPISNMGETPEEIADCWKAIEQIEAAYRANATVQYRFTLNLPHDLTANERREVVQNFCEREFGRLGLPYVAAIHAPDPNGDHRNYHAHILFSNRPFERTGAGEWEFASEKVTELTDKAGLLRLRGLAAAHLNTACRKAGLDLRYTHRSYRDRGIDAKRQEHLGPARVAAHEMGKPVHMVARNASVVAANEETAENMILRRGMAGYERLSGLLDRSLLLLEKRRSTSEQLKQVNALVACSTRLAEAPRRHKPAGLAQASMIATQAMSIQRALDAHSKRKRSIPRNALKGVASAARGIAARVDLQQARREKLAASQGRLLGMRLAVETALARPTEREREAVSMILHSKRFKYQNTSRGTKVLQNEMARRDVALVYELSPNLFRRAVAARTTLDRAWEKRQRKLDAEAAQKAEIARTQMLAEEAVRLIRDVKVRPYRVKGTKLGYDMVRLPEAHRRTITAVCHLAAVQEALIQRYKTDLATDNAVNIARDTVTEGKIPPTVAEPSTSVRPPAISPGSIELPQARLQSPHEGSDPKPMRQSPVEAPAYTQMEDMSDRPGEGAKAADLRAQLSDDEAARRRDQLEAAKKGEVVQHDKPQQRPRPFDPFDYSR